jgi:2-oxoglutarate ferredoxin oxidoreductase subunit alpha
MWFQARGAKDLNMATLAANPSAEDSAGTQEQAAAPEAIVVRFAGDSGDGMQLTGGQFTLSTALAGNDLATFPDFPAEIRAPQGTLFGVSAFQINFGSTQIETAGDAPDVLVAMNPAALKTNLPALKPGGLVIIDTGEFTQRNLDKAKYESNPIEDGSLAKWDVLAFDISALTIEAVKPFGLGNKDALRSKNMWTLGLALWMFDRDRQPLIDWLRAKFKAKPEIAEANIAALNAGHAYGETAELSGPLKQVSIGPAKSEPGTYRTITGAESVSLGLVAGAQLAELPIFFGGYPITPASAILHHLARLKEFGVTTFQAEDEIAAICAAIGASYAGQLGVTSSSGPGIALKGEAMGLAIMTELPLVIVNSQRGGPSTGLPTKTEQSDLYQAVYGRNGDAPLPVIAARSPADAFEVAIEACRLATQYMTPVILLTDGYIANAAEPWKVPDPAAFEAFPVRFLEEKNAGDRVLPYRRDDKGARPWIKPGTPGLMHRIGGIEKHVDTGNIDYSPANHQAMTDARKAKIDNIAVPDQEVALGDDTGRLAVVGWGSTYGPIHQAVRRARAQGRSVSHIHVRHVWPLPKNLGQLLAGFDRVLVPEMNTGQFKTVLRDQLLIDTDSLTKTSGQPFAIAELEEAIARYFDGIPNNEGGEVGFNPGQLPEPESGHDDGSLNPDLRSPQSEVHS